MLVSERLSSGSRRYANAYKATRLVKSKPKVPALSPPTNWQDWLKTLFPKTFTAPFADRHIKMWEWVETIEVGKKPSPSCYVSPQPRGGGKTTSAESAVIRLGAKNARRFVLYVRSTQDKANESIKNIAGKLETRAMSQYHPDLSERNLGKYGHSKGWNVSTLRTASDFNVVGLGLDAAVRGVKLDDYRPDIIIFDDIDDKEDTDERIEKKIRTITLDILPAGASHCAYLVVQNLIHPNGIMSQLVKGTADFLHDREVGELSPALLDFEYESKPEGGYRITAGTPTWAGQGLETCQAQIDDWGISAFLKEAQHEVKNVKGGMFNHVEFRRVESGDLPDFVRGAVWCDPAVTTTNNSDSMAVVAGGVDISDKITTVYHFEQITTPVDTLQRAFRVCIQYGFGEVGIETDQGGDTWYSVAYEAWDKMKHEFPPGTRMPAIKQAKAGAGHGSKVERWQRVLVPAYENGKIQHMRGTHKALENALERVPKVKPYDLVDALYWLVWDLKRGFFAGGWQQVENSLADYRG